MTAPKYTGLQKEDIPSLSLDNGKVILHAVSGNWKGTKAAFEPLTDISLSWIELKKGGRFSHQIPSDQNIFFYVVKGDVTVNEADAHTHHLVQFEQEGEELTVEAHADAVILLGYATPFNEPFVAYGPFVMNTREEIMQAYDDFNKGMFGREDDLY